jgi:RNA polymerase sigma factor (sigma-70 family)
LKNVEGTAMPQSAISCEAPKANSLEELVRSEARKLQLYLKSSISERQSRLIAPEDLVQDVWLTTIKTLRSDGLDSIRNPASWLRQIARRKLIDSLKTARRIKRGAAESRRLADHDSTAAPASRKGLARLVDMAASPANQAIRRELGREIARAIDSLGIRQRNAIRQRLLGLTVSEIALINQMSVSAVEGLVSRGLHTLRSRLKFLDDRQSNRSIRKAGVIVRQHAGRGCRESRAISNVT